MDNPLVGGVLLFTVGLFAGVVNVIAGGGSFLTVPLMIFLGLPATVANGTNRLAIITQNVGAVWSFQKRGLISRQWLVLGAAPSVLGAVLGTFAAVEIGDLAFQRVLALMMVALTAYTVWRPLPAVSDAAGTLPTGGRRVAFIVGFFLVGVYGGFIQAGVGFLVLAVTSAGGLDLIRGNAVKVTLLLIFTPLTLLVFAANGKVDWAMAVWLAAGNYLGGVAGVHLQVLKGHAWVRNAVTAMIVVFALKLFLAA
ncbi:MAG TPA: sulfite exporter TauE/SafE family protein [Longimicrobiales bacterium]|nr:sulfite exporter TauE/SafE family protein [Longimicrobiales bacterium]